MLWTLQGLESKENEPFNEDSCTIAIFNLFWMYQSTRNLVGRRLRYECELKCEEITKDKSSKTPLSILF